MQAKTKEPKIDYIFSSYSLFVTHLQFKSEEIEIHKQTHETQKSELLPPKEKPLSGRLDTHTKKNIDTLYKHTNTFTNS